MITKLSLENFKIFQKQDFDLAPLTLITGINGMGKSSIIQSLLLLKQSYSLRYLNKQNKVDLDNDYINLESAEGLCYGMASVENKNVLVSLTDDHVGIHQWLIDASDPKGKVLNCNYSGDGSFDKLALFNDNFIFLDAERWGPKQYYNRKEKRAYNTKLGIQGELAPAYIANAISANEEIGIPGMKHINCVSNGLYQNLNVWMSEIMNLPLQTRVTEVDQNTIKLSYNFEGSMGKRLTFCLPVVLAPLIATPGDMIIIENPEAHLHPSAQMKIGLLLATAVKNGIHVIIESHSDHILNSVRYAYKENILQDGMLSLIFIQGSIKNDISTPYPEYVKISPKGKLSHRPKDFFDEWDNMLSKLI